MGSRKQEKQESSDTGYEENIKKYRIISYVNFQKWRIRGGRVDVRWYMEWDLHIL